MLVNPFKEPEERKVQATGEVVGEEEVINAIPTEPEPVNKKVLDHSTALGATGD